MKRFIKLGVNIDHVATLRQARRGMEPHVLQAARDAVSGGADSITVHLREDRRHIQDRDVHDIKQKIHVPLNLEMSIAPEIVNMACKVKPQFVCLVPEKREELTTEGGLDILGAPKKIKEVVRQLHDHDILVSLFIDAQLKQISAAFETGTDFIEIHTGHYANEHGAKKRRELQRIREAALFASKIGLGVNAGHGLNYENVKAILKIKSIGELNIGHSIVSRAVFVGLKKAVQEMKQLLQ